MPGRIVGAAEFKADCLRLIDEMNKGGGPVTITRRGKPVARMVPVAPEPVVSIIGALRLPSPRYDAPFAPAAEPQEWDAVRQDGR